MILGKLIWPEEARERAVENFKWFTTDKVAGLMEKEECSEEELDEALKDFAWQFMKLPALQ